MTSKLTLSINDSVVRRAKRYASDRGKSLSQIVEQYLSYVTQDDLQSAEVTEEVIELSDTLSASLVEGDWKLDYLTDKHRRE